MEEDDPEQSESKVKLIVKLEEKMKEVTMEFKKEIPVKASEGTEWDDYDSEDKRNSLLNSRAALSNMG